MPHATVMMDGSYEPGLVAFSIVIAVIASYTALDLAGRVTAAKGRARAAWLGGGALAMGIGIWSMHFIGMLAFSMPSMQMAYDVPTVLLSLLIAVLASGLALLLVSRGVMTRGTWLSGGLCMGLGIASMHYSGMTALRMDLVAGQIGLNTVITYQPLLFALSILIAIVASLAALWLSFTLRRQPSTGNWWTVGGAAVMGIAISGMHYTGMAAAHFHYVGTAAIDRDAVYPSLLATVAIGIVTLLVLGFTLITALLDRRVTTQAAEAAVLRQLGDERARLLAREQEARAQAEAAQRRLSLLAEASTILSDSLDYAVTLHNIAHLIVPALADWCVISVIEADGRARRVGAAHAEPDKEELLHNLDDLCPMDLDGPHPTLGVLRSGQMELVEQVMPDLLDRIALSPEHRRLLDALGCASCFVAPLMAHGHMLGTLCCVSTRPDQRYSASDAALGMELARRIAMAVDNGHLYRQVQDAVRIRDDFLASASHDLRTPLTAIKGRSDLMRIRLNRIDGDVSTDDITWLRQQVDAVSRGVERLLGAVNEISDVSHLQIGQSLELHLDLLNVGELVRHAVGTAADAQGHNVTRPVVNAPDSIMVNGDRVRLERVIHNIVGNALKYSGDAALPVTITVFAQDDDAIVTVRDHGVGIPADEIEHIFTRFYRASTAQGVVGTGIGLAGSKTIVEQHGGRITLESAVGEGTTVTMALPLAGTREIVRTQPA